MCSSSSYCGIMGLKTRWISTSLMPPFISTHCTLDGSPLKSCSCCRIVGKKQGTSAEGMVTVYESRMPILAPECASIDISTPKWLARMLAVLCSYARPWPQTTESPITRRLFMPLGQSIKRFFRRVSWDFWRDLVELSATDVRDVRINDAILYL